MATLKTISAQAAVKLDQDLMSKEGGFSIDQLMELAGLSVSQAVFKCHPPSKGKKVLVVCGPGNNGGDGLVAARHLWHYGYQPTIYYPKKGRNELYERLTIQLNNLKVPFIEDADFKSTLYNSDHVIDAIFGFSFSGPIRSPFDNIITLLSSHPGRPITSVDVPSSWGVDSGPPSSGIGSDFIPNYLVSLTAPKPCSKLFHGRGKRHFLGGRFVSPVIAERYGLELPEYPGLEQVVELPVPGGESEEDEEEGRETGEGLEGGVKDVKGGFCS